MWDLPRPGIEPVSSALAGRFLTTAPPGKPLNQTLEEGKQVAHQLPELSMTVTTNDGALGNPLNPTESITMSHTEPQ